MRLFSVEVAYQTPVFEGEQGFDKARTPLIMYQGKLGYVNTHLLTSVLAISNPEADVEVEVFKFMSDLKKLLPSGSTLVRIKVFKLLPGPQQHIFMPEEVVFRKDYPDYISRLIHSEIKEKNVVVVVS